MKKNARAFQALFLFLTIIFIVSFFQNHKRAFRNQNSSNFFDELLYSPAVCNTSDSCIDIKREEKSLKPGALPTQTQSGYCISVPVLLYHHIQPQSEAIRKGQTSLSVDNGIFDLQMKYLLENGYNTINAPTLINALLSRTPLPSKSIIVTIDDGYKDAFFYAFPILKKYHITANFMIAAGLIGGSDYMSWDDINQLKQSGLAYFVNHTLSHFAVSHGASDKIHYEILTGKQQLEQNTGQTVNIFAYPYGYFNNNAISILQSDGFSGAFSTIPGFLQCDSFIMTLHRNHVGNAPLSAYGL